MRNASPAIGSAKTMGVVGPALTGATVAWVIFFLAFNVFTASPEGGAWEPSYRDLGWLWIVTCGSALMFSFVGRLSPFVAATLAVFLGTTLTFAASCGAHIARYYAWETPPPSAVGMTMGFVPIAALITFFAGAFWVPAVLLSSVRYRKLERRKELNAHA